MEVYYEHNKKQISFLVGILLPYPHCLFYIWRSFFITMFSREGANKRGNSSRMTQSFHFFMFEPIFSPVNALNQPI